MVHHHYTNHLGWNVSLFPSKFRWGLGPKKPGALLYCSTCSTDQGSSCMIFDCAKSRGPTHCNTQDVFRSHQGVQDCSPLLPQKSEVMEVDWFFDDFSFSVGWFLGVENGTRPWNVSPPRRIWIINHQDDMKPFLSGWWFQTFFMFTPTWGNNPFWLIFFRWVETTN